MNDYDNKLRRIDRAASIYQGSPLEFARVVRLILYPELHTHVASHDRTDACRVCGLDLRDDIHKRVKEK